MCWRRPLMVCACHRQVCSLHLLATGYLLLVSKQGNRFVFSLRLNSSFNFRVRVTTFAFFYNRSFPFLIFCASAMSMESSLQQLDVRDVGFGWVLETDRPSNRISRSRPWSVGWSGSRSDHGPTDQGPSYMVGGRSVHRFAGPTDRPTDQHLQTAGICITIKMNFEGDCA